MQKFSFGAQPSPYDIRTFTYIPDKANIKGGTKWEPKDIEHQHYVGICTAISLTMRAQKFYNKKFSPDFQYLMQKRLEKNWDEGSSISTALKIGKNIGFLPIEEFPVTEEDRKVPYSQYILKLQAISEEEITRLCNIASKYKLSAYASVPVTRDNLANAIDGEGSLLVRFNVGEEWWTSPIEPLRSPKKIISGHAINETNYNGNSFRVANSWGATWADGGTAYHILNDYQPTEAWAVWFTDIPSVVVNQIDSRATIIGNIMDLLQQVIILLAKLK